MLEFAPQSEKHLKARYPEALRHIFELREVLNGMRPRPGELRRNVFDFPDGLRLIISREDIGRREGLWLHFSASVSPGTALHHRLMGLAENATLAASAAAACAGLRQAAEEAFARISGEQIGVWEFGGFSKEKGVPHWYRALSSTTARIRPEPRQG